MGWFVALGLVLAACQGSAATTSESARSESPRSTSSPPPTAGPASLPIIGEWVATQECQRIADMLAAAGFDEFIAEQIYEFVPSADSPEDIDLQDPCPNAVPLQHSHFFTPGGTFGSRDYAGRQVDDGTYEVHGSTLVINGTAFAFEINGSVLTLQPEAVDISGCTTRECRFQGAWVLMVSMPGTKWVRGTISP
jgi:hypothetical protein